MTANGTLVALLAYVLWGVFPVYWKMIADVPALEILYHRMVWSFVFAVILLSTKRHGQWLRQVWGHPRILLTSLLTACLLSLNWFIYIWAVNSGHIVDASLGYFINPLVNVFLGVLFLKERLRGAQWLAICLAGAGVGYLMANQGGLPWVSLSLAFSFGIYGLLRKTASLKSLEGFALETGYMFLPGLMALLLLAGNGGGSFGQGDMFKNIMLPLTGVATALPLLFFAYGAQRITLTRLGILQYVAPTLQFLLGVMLYGEVFSEVRVTGFTIIQYLTEHLNSGTYCFSPLSS